MWRTLGGYQKGKTQFLKSLFFYIFVFKTPLHVFLIQNIESIGTLNGPIGLFCWCIEVPEFFLSLKRCSTCCFLEVSQGPGGLRDVGTDGTIHFHLISSKSDLTGTYRIFFWYVETSQGIFCKFGWKNDGKMSEKNILKQSQKDVWSFPRIPEKYMYTTSCLSV